MDTFTLLPTGSPIADKRLRSIRDFIVGKPAAEAIEVLRKWQDALSENFATGAAPRGAKVAGWAIVVANVLAQLGRWECQVADGLVSDDDYRATVRREAAE